MMATGTQADKRTTRRIPLALPVSVKAGDGAVASETRNVSARGVFFYIDSAPAEGSELEFTLTLPPEVTMTEPLRIQCRGRVVRVEKGGARTGIAAAIEKYEITTND